MALPLYLIYRIISYYKSNNDKQNEPNYENKTQNERKIMLFIIKSFDKFNSDASILINFIDFQTIGQEFINIIKENNYINIINFAVLSNNLLKQIFFYCQSYNHNNEENSPTRSNISSVNEEKLKKKRMIIKSHVKKNLMIY